MSGGKWEQKIRQMQLELQDCYAKMGDQSMAIDKLRRDTEFLKGTNAALAKMVESEKKRVEDYCRLLDVMRAQASKWVILKENMNAPGYDPPLWDAVRMTETIHERREKQRGE